MEVEMRVKAAKYRSRDMLGEECEWSMRGSRVGCSVST